MSQKHSDYKMGDIIKGLQLISEPYKINGRKEYRVMVKCTMCNKEPYEIILTEIKRHTYDGCPECAKRQRFKTHDKFIAEMRDKNPDIIIVGKYISNKNKIECRCAKCGYEFNAYPNNLLQGHGCKKCADQKSSLLQRREHSDFVNMVKNINPNIEIISTYVRSSDTIKCRCLIDGYEWDAWPSHLLRGHGCPVCNGNKLFVGHNDIATIRPDLVKYFKCQDDAKIFTQYSNKYADLICPYCGYEKTMLVGHLSKTGFACPICSDGISYPNKFIRYFLRQLPIENLECEYHSNWTKSYLYDTYFEYNGEKYIVEADGLQHFIDTSSLWPSSDKTKQIDYIKTQLAIDNGVVVIRIDCRKSNMNFIKNNILNSCLAQIFDLSHIDWLLCENNARSSFVYEICSYYSKSKNKTLKEISDYFDLSKPTVSKYLHAGTEIGICNYTPRKNQFT